jgi:hypothetical protein
MPQEIKITWGIFRGEPSIDATRNQNYLGYFQRWQNPTRETRLTRPDPNPTRDQMAFNPIKIYQRSEKT